MHDSRPKNLNLFTIHFPLPSIVSISHRISGVVLFLLIPVLLWGLKYSLTAEGFYEISQWTSQPVTKFFIWLFLIPLCFHFVAGIRHLLMDIEIGVSFRWGWITGFLTYLITAILALLIGIWLW